MKKTHYGLVGVGHSKDEPPYFIYKQDVSWTKDPADMLESSRAGEVTAVTGTGQRLYFCGEAEDGMTCWSEDKEAATSYGERELAIVALYRLEDRGAASG